MAKCPMCGSEEFIYDEHRGVVYCAKCGYVVEDHVIDLGPEWRGVDKYGRPMARASPISIAKPGQGLGDITLLEVKKSMPIRMYIRPLTLLTSKEKNIGALRTYTKQMVALLGLPESVVDEVSQKYRILLNKGYKGNVKETALALLIIICRERKISGCSVKSILKNTDVKPRRLHKVYSMVVKLLNINTINEGDEYFINVVLKILDELKVTGDVRYRVFQFIRELMEKGKVAGLFNGKSPISMIAAMAYLALTVFNIKVKQKDVARMVDVTDVTIRSRYNELVDRLSIVINI